MDGQEVGPEEHGCRGKDLAWLLSLFPVSLWLQEWFTVYEHNRRPSCTVSDLIMGNEYSFRVFSENVCGRSNDPGVSKNTAVIGKTGAERLRLHAVALEADAC